MLKRLAFLCLCAFMTVGCFTYQYDSCYTPTSKDDGIFSFKIDGYEYRQVMQQGSSAYAISHPNLDTLIIVGRASPLSRRDNLIHIYRIVFIIPLNDVGPDNTIHLTKENIIFEMEHEEPRRPDGSYITWSEYMYGEEATIKFKDFVDPMEENQYISGTFEIDGPVWEGKQIIITDGVFKFWVITTERRFRNSNYPVGYNVGYWS